jgi:hypothetical protein
MAFGLDSSVVLAWLLPDESNYAADTLADRLQTEPAVVPAIWRLEVANTLLMARRRHRLTDRDVGLTDRDVGQLLAALVGLPIDEEPGPDEASLSKVGAWRQAQPHFLRRGVSGKSLSVAASRSLRSSLACARRAPP